MKGGSIGQQIKGEMGELVKEVAKGVTDAPRQIIEGPAKQKGSQPDVSELTSSGSGDDQDDQVGKMLEKGQQVGDASKAQQQAADDYGWGAALQSQLGIKPASKQETEKKLQKVRRDLDKEIQAIRKRKEQEEEQKKQAEEEQKEQIKEAKEEQKKEAHKQDRVQQMLGLGKGERMGTKGK